MAAPEQLVLLPEVVVPEQLPYGRRWPRRKQLAMWTEVVGPDRSTVRPEVVAPDRLAVRPEMAVPKAAGCVDEGGSNNILSSNNA